MMLERESFGILVVWGRTNYGGTVSGSTRKSEAVQSYEELRRGKERRRWPWIRIGLVLRGVETTMWPDITLPTYPKSCCFTFPICSISCLPSITPLKSFSCWLAFFPLHLNTENKLNFFDSRKPGCFLKVQFNTLPPLPQVVSLLCLHLQLHLLIRLAYCFPHYIDIAVSRPYFEHIFRWIKTIYLSLGSCYSACITCLLQNLISCRLFD